ncbi:MAG: hypothetical protein FJ280_00905 [Planctomycetes bacterium]|nr:hypothetical protein [Planctomycetota bacterium]
MSMTASYKTEIIIPKPQLAQLRGNIKGVPCMEIMRLAFEKIAREKEGTLTQGYGDCGGKQHDCLMGLRTKRLPRGIGINVASDGRVLFEFDRQNSDVSEAGSICRDIARAYAIIAIMRVQSQHGYEVSVQQETATVEGRTAVISAVRA